MALLSSLVRSFRVGTRPQSFSLIQFRSLSQITTSRSGILANHWFRRCNEKADKRIPCRESWAWLCIIGGMIISSEAAITCADHPVEVATDDPSSVVSNVPDMETTAKLLRQSIEEILRSKGVRSGFAPRYSISIKGQKISVKFEIPSTCDIPRLIANLSSNLGVKVPEVGGSEMILHAWDSSVAWQLTLNNKTNGSAKATDDDLSIVFFRSILTNDKAEVEFTKSGRFNSNELEAFVSSMIIAGESKHSEGKTVKKSPKNTTYKSVASSLESMGIRIYGLEEHFKGSVESEILWDNIAGYKEQKREIEDTILLTLQSPEVYDEIARGTRCKFESNRPRAVLFEGPPGTGKTSSARVIASQAGVPMLYVPLEVVMSKYYGESERLLGKVFSLANELPEGAIIFLDEVDSFAAARDSEMHEATRRMLSVLLRQIDGFEQDKKVVVIAATNRKQDLDPALISRFDSIIGFGLPDQETREDITAQYAKHLSKQEREEIARLTEGMSGRDIRDICLRAERSWASKIIRGLNKGVNDSLPPALEYVESAVNRRNAIMGISRDRLPRASISQKLAN